MKQYIYKAIGHDLRITVKAENGMDADLLAEEVAYDWPKEVEGFELESVEDISDEITRD